ncbi:hypothetical protein VCRA2133E348_430023 [Vibrio crassostreae]|nr:hypothetical protein VCRA2133E348_430023 [Vibrio crassostreae]CAK3463578.1 hypothetical protein VCRA213O314_450021 [Vibrio crassostreae]
MSNKLKTHLKKHKLTKINDLHFFSLFYEQVILSFIRKYNNIKKEHNRV